MPSFIGPLTVLQQHLTNMDGSAWVSAPMHFSSGVEWYRAWLDQDSQALAILEKDGLEELADGISLVIERDQDDTFVLNYVKNQLDKNTEFLSPSGKDLLIGSAVSLEKEMWINIFLPHIPAEQLNPLLLFFAAELGNVRLIERLFPLITNHQKTFIPLMAAAVHRKTAAVHLLLPFSDVKLAHQAILDFRAPDLNKNEVIQWLYGMDKKRQSDQEKAILEESAQEIFSSSSPLRHYRRM